MVYVSVENSATNWGVDLLSFYVNGIAMNYGLAFFLPFSSSVRYYNFIINNF